jgi:hypothetical protein
MKTESIKKEVLQEQRESLRMQFIAYSNEGRLNEIRKNDPNLFCKLWEATFGTDPKPQLVNELDAAIDQAIFIGLAPKSDRTQFVLLGGKDWQTLNNLKVLFDAARAGLCAQFDAHAQEETMDDLKKQDRATFNKLWRAKFLTEPK